MPYPSKRPLLPLLAVAAGIALFIVFMLPQVWIPVTITSATLRLLTLLIGVALFAGGLGAYNRLTRDGSRTLAQGVSSMAPIFPAEPHVPEEPYVPPPMREAERPAADPRD